MGGGGGTTTQENQPWGPQGDQLRNIYGEAQRLYGNPLQYYPQSTVGGRSAMTLEGEQAGLGLIRGAGQGSEFGYLNDVLGGQFLNHNSNPYVRDLADQGAADITRQFKTSMFPGASMLGAGRSGSMSEQNLQGRAYRELGDSLSRNYSNTYGQNYARERGFMQQGVGLMQQARAGQRGDLSMGYQLGQGADAYQQRQLSDQVNRFNFNQNEPNQRLSRYNQMIQGGGTIPGITTQSAPSQGFGAAQGIGAGLGFLSLLGGPTGILAGMGGLAAKAATT